MSEREQMRPWPAAALVVNLAIAGIALAQAGPSGVTAALRTNDPLFPKQEALFNRINVFDAWKVTKGDPNVWVGVIDLGFDFYHPDLRANLVPGFFADGTYHTEFFQNVGHGTIVVSLIAAVGNNGMGMTGLAPRCRVLAAAQGVIEHKLAKLQNKFRQDHPDSGPTEFFQTLKAEDRTALKSFSRDWIRFVTVSTAEAIRYLVDHKVRVINISELLKQGAGPADSWQIVDDAFAYAREKGVIIVLGAGNNGALCEDYPGNPDSVIVVGATRLDDTRWEETTDIQGTKIKQGSNFGKRLTVMAPMENLQVCVPHDKRFYTCEDGPMGPTKQDFHDMYDTAPQGATSCATPVVTSLVALIYSVRPDLEAKTVVEIIQQGCDDIGDKGYDIYTGFGRVNFGKTIKLALAHAR